MQMPDDAEWLAHLTRRAEWARVGSEPRLRTALRRGELRSVAPGVYLPTTIWCELDADARFRVTVHAAATRYPTAVFSHFSAAALWRLPAIDPWPSRAEAVVARASGGRSRAGLVQHAEGAAVRTVGIDGVEVTDIARTVLDIAGTASFGQAVAMADRALARPESELVSENVISPTDLVDELNCRPTAHANARRRAVIEFADGRSGSPGESISRVAIRTLGFPAPELQTAFHDALGLIGYVDFWWPEWGVIGEFDGQGKYLRDELRGGRTVAEVVMAEKQRENRLRALARTVVRWEWREARTPRLLEARLAAAGLPRRRA